jgi:hypothetical protein
MQHSWGKKNAYRILAGKPLGRQMRRKDNFKMELTRLCSGFK